MYIHMNIYLDTIRMTQDPCESMQVSFYPQYRREYQYRVAYSHRIPYLRRSFSAKEPYN